jgi:hypothetical protein
MTTFTWDGQSPVSGGAPEISGIAQQGRVLAETHGEWSNSPTAYRYQWLSCDGRGRGCTPIAGASGQTYTPVPGDVGATIRVQETASNASGTGGPVSSAQTPVVLPPLPSSGSPPTISGVAQQGQTLVEVHGSWSNSPTGYGYQWLRCKAGGKGCAPIAAAKGQRYTPGAGDVAGAIRVQETATNAGGQGVPVRSAPSQVVLPSTASLRALLVKVLAPSPALARIAALLDAGGYALSFRTPAAGYVEIDWYYLPRGAKLAKAKGAPAPVLVGSGSTYVLKAGPVKLKIKLTHRGAQMLGSAKSLKLVSKGTYTVAVGLPVIATAGFTLRR